MNPFAEPLWLAALILPAVVLLAGFGKGHAAEVDRLRIWSSSVFRCLALVCLVLALAGPLQKRSLRSLELVFVLDRSHSISHEQSEAALHFINRVSRTQGEPLRIGLVVFGSNAAVERGLRDTGYGIATLHSEVDGDGTDIGRALEVALGSFTGDGQRRIVLLSDGGENLGDARTAVAAVRSVGAEVVTIALRRQRRKDEVVVERLRLPDAVRVDEPFEVRLNVGARQAAQAEISILRNGEVQRTEIVDLRAGTNTFTYTEQGAEPGLFEYETIVNSDSDAVIENNRYRGFVRVIGAPQVLYARGETDLQTPVVDALHAQGFAVQVVSSAALPATLHELVEYDLLILDNVSGYDLSLAKMDLLEEYVRATGGGVLTLGGTRSYSAGGFYDTPVERLLPVTMDVKTEVKIPSAAVVVLVDKSGSMQTGQKLAIAKAAALASVDVLNPLDRVGVLAFDSEFEWAVPVTDAGNRRQVVEKLRPLAAGGSTRIYPALAEAHRAVTATQARVKHLIVLSDGLTNQGDDYAQLLQRIRADDVGVSTVALGRDADQDLMKTMASLGGGRYYFSEDPKDIPRIFTSETMIVTRDLMVDEPTEVDAADGIEALQGLRLDSLPILLGYQRTYPKTSAEVWLSSDAGEPLLAAWRYGLGKSIAFMSDLSGRWGVEWVGWDAFGRFVAQMARWTMRKQSRDQLRTRFEWQGRDGQLTVDALDFEDNYINGLTLQARATIPGGIQKTLALEQISPGRYQVPVPAASTGRYYFTISGDNGAVTVGPQTFGAAIPYSREFFDQGVNETLLEDIAKGTGGRFLELSAAANKAILATDDEATRSQVDYVWPLGLAALLLFLLDLAARKLALPDWLRRFARQNRPLGKVREADYSSLVASIEQTRRDHLAALKDGRNFHPRLGEATIRARLYVASSGQRQGSAAPGRGARRP